jgi:hypothetical protein
MHRSATICNAMPCMIPSHRATANNRSKFNPTLGIEAQGFCIIPQQPGR